MGSAYKGSTFKFKKLEDAYNSLSDAGFSDIADKIEEVMSSEGYIVKLVGNKYKFKYNG